VLLELMRAIYITLVTGIFLLFGAANAFAGALQDIRVTLESGQYDLAAEQASGLGTTDGLVLAAEALNAKLLLGHAKHKTKTAKRSMKLAKAALELDPNNPEAQFQYALAYGFYGRYASSFKAWRKKLPQKIRIEIEKAAAMAPEDPRVEALKGAWHWNLLYRANGFDVGKRFGASEEVGRRHFQKALQNNPDGRIIMYANFLMLDFILHPEKQAAPTKRALKTNLLPLQPQNAIERQILVQMQNIYTGFETGTALKQAKNFVEQ